MVSVIIPIYKVEKYLKQCVDSVLEQTYSDLQIILVDDGSPDRCGEICDQYKAMDARIQVIHKKNGGLGYARNSGLEIAEGNYVIFIDSDDWIEKNHIEKLVAVAERTQADVVIHGFKKVNDEKEVLFVSKTIKIGEFLDVKKDILYPMIAAGSNQKEDTTLPVAAWCKMYRLSIIQDNELLFPSERECISEDIMFNFVFYPYCEKAVIIEENGYNYRYNPNSISNNYNPMRTLRMFEFYKRMMTWYGSVTFAEPELLQRLYRCYIMKCRIGVESIVGSNLSFLEKVKEIKKITSHEYTRTALTQFKVQQYSLKLRLILELMKLNSALLLILAYSIK